MSASGLRSRGVGLVAGLMLLVGIAGPACAAGYPDRPVTLVVAFTPGGPSDVLARIVGKAMESIFGKPL